MAEPSPHDFQELNELLSEVLARQDRMEQRIARLEGAQASPSPEPVVVEDISATEVPPVVMTAEPKLESKLGLTLINRIGVVTLVLGVAFFFKWAVDNNWVGPTGRVILGVLAGCSLCLVADVLWHKGQQVFAQGITGAGVAVVYLAFYASFDFYHLIPQSVAFLLLVATTVLAAALAWRYSAMAIASLGFFGAYLIPLLLSNGANHPWFLLSYLLLLDAAAGELSRRRRWAFLEMLSFAASTLIFGAWLLRFGSQPPYRTPAVVGVLALCAQRARTTGPLLFLLAQALSTFAITIHAGSDSLFGMSLVLLVTVGGLAFARWRNYRPIVATAFASFWLVIHIQVNAPGLYLLTGSLGGLLFLAWCWWRYAWLDEKPNELDFGVFALNGPLYYAFAYSLLNDHQHAWLGLLAVLVGAVYLTFGLLLHQRKRGLQSDLVALAIGLAIAFLALAIPIQLAGYTVTIGWSVQAAALTWIALRLHNRKAAIGALLVFGLAVVHLLAFDAGMYKDPYVYTALLNTRFLVFAVLAAALLISACWIATLEARLALAAFIAGHLVMLAGLCLEVIGWAQRSTDGANVLSRETIGITILFALYAMVLVALGVARRSTVQRWAGLALTAVVILKLYIFDVWQLGRVYQIAAFVILGLLLLSTSFLYSRFRGWIENWKQDKKSPG